MSERVVITGGTGFIGTALCRELLRRGREPVVLSRRPETARVPAGARAVGWDGRTAAGWLAEADGALAIVNLAGAGIADGRWTPERKRLILESRLRASAAVVEAVERAGRRPRVIVQGSAVGFYGDAGERRCDESDPPGEGFLAETAAAWEAATAHVEELGARRVVIRTSLVLGPGGGFLSRLAPLYRLGLGGPAGGGGQWMSWIHLDDEAAAIRFLVDRDDLSGPFNLAAPAPARNAEFARELGGVLGRPAFLRAPAFLMRLALGEMAGELILAGQRAPGDRLAAAGFSFAHPSLREALAASLKGNRRS